MKITTAVLVAMATCVVLTQSRERPLRIVSTSPSTTEMLFALGLGDRVVGVSQFCRYPPQVTALPKVGTILRPDFEQIVMLRPDLVVITDKNSNLAPRLSAAQIPFVVVATTTLTDVSAAMVRIGAAAGIEAHARTVVAGIEQRLANIRRQAAPGPRPRVLLIMGRTTDALTGIVAAGAGSYLSELLAIAGGTNAIAEASTLPYPQLSLESILHLDPDVIVDTVDMGAPEAERRRQNQASQQLWSGYRTLTAVRSGRVYAAETDALFTPGPRVVEATEWLAHLLQGPPPR